MTFNTSLSNLQGSKIFFSTAEENFIGIIFKVCSQTNEVTMSKLLSLTNYKRTLIRTFSICDILNYKLISGDTSISNTGNESSLDVTSSVYKNVRNYELSLPAHISDSLPFNNVIIDNIDEKFYDGIGHFKKQDTIGISLEGFEINRHGKVQWLTVSTSFCTFLFDLQKLGNNAFKEGLKIMLESDTITKVIHDCRLVADCLFHQFGIKLTKVYDTQVAEFMVNAQKKSIENVTTQVKSLDYCLVTYLEVPKKYLYLDVKILDSTYNERPLSYNLRNILIKNVIYLRRLKQELDIILRTPFRRCVDIHLQTILRKTDQDLTLHPPQLDFISEEILTENYIRISLYFEGFGRFKLWFLPLCPKPCQT